MNIAFDMFFANTEAMKRGIGRYSQNLIESILKQDTNHTFFYFYPDVSKGSAHLKDQLQQFLVRNRIDLYHMMSPFNLFHLPASLFQAYSEAMLNKAWFGYTRVAATLYDVIPLVLEKQYMNDFVRPIYMKVIEMIRSCDIIFAISETTKQDAVRLAGMDPAKISVIMGGYDPRFKPIPNFNSQPIKAKYGITKSYILCTGGDDPRKNLARLIAAFGDANRALGYISELVIVYNATDAEKKTMMEQAAQAGAHGSVIATGYVPDEDLLELYNGATVFAFPSLYEGFGLPIVEAMACGVPVLTSNNSSLAEISGDAAQLVVPDNQASIAGGIVELISNPARRAELIKRGTKQSAKFNWVDVAQRVTDGYETVLRRKIAVFAVTHALISNVYGALYDTVPMLTERCEIDVYVELVPSEGKPQEVMGSSVALYSHTEFNSRKSQYDYVIFELGNEDRYLFIVPYLGSMWTIPGIVILSQSDLHPLTVKWTLDRNSILGYYKVLEQEFKGGAQVILDRILSGVIDRMAVPLNRYYLVAAKAVVVFSKAEQNKLIQHGYRNVVHANVPVQAPITDDNRTSREVTDLVFSTFITDESSSEIPMILRCFQAMLAQGNKDFSYYIAGTLKADLLKEFKSQIVHLGLQKYVQFVGELNQTKYVRMLRKTDVVIQLQKPELGESPYAAFETMGYGIPTLMYEGPSFRELPEATSLMIPRGPNAEGALLNVMKALYTSQATRKAVSDNTLRYLQNNHSIPQYAEAIREAIERGSMMEASPAVVWRIQESSDGVPRIRGL
jgi:glycosyltransferase involved in cell wall biosynthesis